MPIDQVPHSKIWERWVGEYTITLSHLLHAASLEAWSPAKSVCVLPPPNNPLHLMESRAQRIGSSEKTTMSQSEGILSQTKQAQ